MSTLLSPAECEGAAAKIAQLEAGMNQRLLGQEELIRMVVTACLARGNVLLEGLPGLGKTELVKGLSRLLGLDFQRIQFTLTCRPATSPVQRCWKNLVSEAEPSRSVEI